MPRSDRNQTRIFAPRKIFSRPRPLILAVLMVMVMVALLATQGCTRKKAEEEYLIRVRHLSLTLSEFNQTVDAACDEAFPGEKNIAAPVLNDLRIRILNQSTEELMISAFAADQGIQVSDEEVEKAVAGIKADYPENTFEETLLENAVSFQVWKKKLAARLLVEKVIAKELVNQVQISTDDISQYYKTNYPQGIPEGQSSDEINQRIINHLRQQKAENAYKDWIETLRKSYPVEVNHKAWDRLIGGKP